MTNGEKKYFLDLPTVARYGLYPYNINVKHIAYGIEDYIIIEQNGRIYSRKIHYNGEKSYITFAGLKRYTRDFLRV